MPQTVSSNKSNSGAAFSIITSEIENKSSIILQINESTRYETTDKLFKYTILFKCLKTVTTLQIFHYLIYTCLM